MPGWRIADGRAVVVEREYSEGDKWVSEGLMPARTGERFSGTYAPGGGTWDEETLRAYLARWGVPMLLPDDAPVGAFAVKPMRKRDRGYTYWVGVSVLMHPTIEILSPLAAWVQQIPAKVVRRTAERGGNALGWDTSWKANKAFVAWMKESGFLDALKALVTRMDGAKRAAEVADDESGECQICGGTSSKRFAVIGRVLSKHGYHHAQMLDHGYTGRGRSGRGDMGEQLGECFGALQLPWEVSRDRLGEYIEMVQRPTVARAQSMLAAMQRAVADRRTLVGKKQEYKNRHVVDVLHEEEHDGSATGGYGWSALAERLLHEAERSLKHARLNLDHFEKRYAGWRRVR